eukprot:1187744-Prorocentrum_minimum.AAC.9
MEKPMVMLLLAESWCNTPKSTPRWLREQEYVRGGRCSVHIGPDEPSAALGGTPPHSKLFTLAPPAGAAAANVKSSRPVAIGPLRYPMHEAVRKQATIQIHSLHYSKGRSLTHSTYDETLAGTTEGSRVGSPLCSSGSPRTGWKTVEFAMLKGGELALKADARACPHHPSFAIRKSAVGGAVTAAAGAGIALGLSKLYR